MLIKSKCKSIFEQKLKIKFKIKILVAWSILEGWLEVKQNLLCVA